MIVVIQCAARKRVGAGSFSAKDGRKVIFVADPALAPPRDGVTYSRPDDPDDDGLTWRERLQRYNEAGANPQGFCRACDLYENGVYLRLADRVGLSKLLILSAGWGLVGSAFLLPLYDITFSQAARRTDAYKFRRKGGGYRDFCHLPQGSTEPVIFFGGKDYVSLFGSLTRFHRGPRIVYFNSSTPPDAPGCLYCRYATSTRTNWHYECANAFLLGGLDLRIDE